MKRLLHINPRCSEYDEYLDMHRTGVFRSWHELLRPVVLEKWGELNSECSIESIDAAICDHDASKYTPVEYSAYCNYFYPSEGFEKDEVAFDLAWLHHQNVNPHHPQYWVLIRDDGSIEPQDMPISCICEMLCDWHSFTLRDIESTAYSWWGANKSNMMLSENTIKVVESLIDCLQQPL